jgi:hypothetical protein
MGAMFVAPLAVPEAFGRHGVVFGVAFLIVIATQGPLYALSVRGDRDLLAAIARVAPSSTGGAALIVVAGFVDGALRPLLWLAALALGLAISSGSSVTSIWSRWQIAGTASPFTWLGGRRRSRPRGRSTGRRAGARPRARTVPCGTWRCLSCQRFPALER